MAGYVRLGTDPGNGCVYIARRFNCSLTVSKEALMLKRRQLILSMAATGLAAQGLTACKAGPSREDEARFLRRPMDTTTGDAAIRMRELVRFATLAPSSHNTQCWKFRTAGNTIRIEPDTLRRTPVVDPDDHHLFVSLGCAAENLTHAALAMGLQATARYDPARDGAIEFTLEQTKPASSPLYQAITQRQCTRGDFDGTALSRADLQLLERAGNSPGVRMMILADRPSIEKTLEFVVEANTAQISDPAFVEELKAWVRFSEDEALRTGDGLFAGASGNPAMPRWLGSRLMGLFMTPKSESERYSRQIRNSSGLAVFWADTSDKASWVEVGRSYERFALQATALGIRNAFLNQPVEVSAIRPQFASAIGLGSVRPDLVVRFGRGPLMPMSMRRPAQAVLA